jgi:hypothetical protein
MLTSENLCFKGANMRLRKTPHLFLPAVVLFCSTLSRADFKYTESSKMTGGAMMGAVKFLGAFSKDARQATAPQISTRAVKGNRFREERADGTIEIIDLDGRRFIKIDSKAKTYSILTFEQMKQQMLQAQERAKEEQAKQAGQHPNSNVKITPKIESSETGASRNILGLDAKEQKVRIEMLMETDDPKAKGQQVSTVVDTDSWIAPTVPGYSEIHLFYMKMAKEMDWVPGVVMGGMANGNVKIAMTELKKNNLKLTGLPLLQTVNMSLGGNGMPLQTASGQPAASQPPAPSSPPPAQAQEPANVKDAIAQGIAGRFGLGGFGKKKKKDDQPASTQPAATDSSQPASTSGAVAATGTPGSLMEMSIEVTSFSNNALDQSLFDVPTGYTEVQPDLSAKPGKN